MKPTRKRIAIAATSAAVLTATVTLVSQWEGYYGRTYLDIVSVPTVCFGETEREAVAEGRRRTYSKAECLAMLQESLKGYDEGMKACLTRDLPPSVHIAFLSATYNIGIGGFCKSSMARRANAGDFKGACNALLMWNKAGGRVVRGLENRRRAEHKICLEDA